MENNHKFFALLPMRTVLFLIIFCGLGLLSKKNLAEITRYWSIVAVVVNFATIGTLLVILKMNRSNYFKLINYKINKTKPSSIILMSILMIILGIGGMYFAGYLIYDKFPYLAPMMIAPIPLFWAIINVVVLPISTTVAEDGIYLGCGVNQIKNKWIAVIVPAFFYAFQHSFIPTILDLKYMLYRFLSFLPLTIFICLWYYKKRNPLPIMIGHIILNIATALQILLTSAMPDLYIQILNI